jgi:hypothetical protein
MMHETIQVGPSMEAQAQRAAMFSGGVRLTALSPVEYTKAGDSEKKTRWHKVGVAFHNRDGSLQIRLDSFPVNGTLQIRQEDPERQKRLQDQRTTRVGALSAAASDGDVE